MLKSTEAVHGSNVLAEVFWVEPADPVVRLPQFASLVDVDLAGLLGVRLAELLSNLQGINACLKHTSLAAEIGCAVEPKRGGKMKLSLVQHVAIGIVGEIKNSALPLSLEDLAVSLGKGIKWWGIV